MIDDPTPHSPSWRATAAAGMVSFGLVLSLGYLFVWMVGR